MRTRFSMDSSSDALKDLNLSGDEITRLTNAFKNEEFRKLFKEYAEEIADPENRRKYEEDIRAMENDRGMDVQFVHPEPGYVVKTTIDGDQKAFINICKNDKIEKPSTKRQTGPDGKSGLSWSIPHSFAPPRDDVDKKNSRVKVFDFVIHPDTYRMTETNARFKQMINDTAFDGIEKQFGHKIDRKNAKVLRMKFKGTPSATVIRNKVGPAKSRDPDDLMNSFPYPYDEKSTKEKTEERQKKQSEEKKPKIEVLKSQENTKDQHETPKYIIKHQSEMDFQDFRDARDAGASTRPRALVVEISLPLITKASQVDLDIFEKCLSLQSENPAKYKLNVTLPYKVDENDGSAKFDKSKRKLVVTLPVVCEPEPKADVVNGINGHHESGEVLTNGTMNGHHDEKPLVEVIAESKEPTEDTAEKLCSEVSDLIEEMKETCDKPAEQPDGKISTETQSPSAQPEEITTNTTPKTSAKETLTSKTRPAPIDPSIPRMLTEFDYHQNDETVTFILHAGKVDRSSVSLDFPDGPSSLLVDMLSVGEGGFPIRYGMYVRFPSDCTLETDNCRVDVDTQNVVIILVKTDAAIGHWDKFEAGPNANHTQERLFVTRANLQRQLSDLSPEDGAVGPNPKSSANLEVTEMDGDKLILSIKEQRSSSRRKKHLSESADDIEIVHDREIPQNLKGIIKQRSQTVSESSDDATSGAMYGRQSSTCGSDDATSGAIYGRQSSTCGSEYDSSSEENSEGGGRKKTVSFSEHIDKTTYKSNQSVSQLHSTLKNKRKNQRKSERRQQERKHQGAARRRKNSASSEDGSSSRDTSVSPRTSISQDDTAVTMPTIVMPPSSPGADGDDEASPTTDKKICDISSTPAKDAPSSEEDVASQRPPKASLIEELDPESARNREGVQNTSTSPPRASVLDWSEGKNPAEHGTKCAVKLSNSVMFDLDID